MVCWEHPPYAWTAERDEKLRHMRTELNYSIRLCARALEMSMPRVRRRCEDMALLKRVALTAEDDQRIEDMMEEGRALPEIAEDFAVTEAFMRAYCNRVGITRRLAAGARLPKDTGSVGRMLCGNCLGDYWEPDARREGAAMLLPGRCGRDGHRCMRTDFCALHLTAAAIRREIAEADGRDGK